MTSNENVIPLLEAMRLAPLSNSPNPGSPLTTAPNTETTAHSSMPTSALPTQAENQSPEDIPTHPTSSNSTPPLQPSSNNQSSLITTLQPYSPSFRNTPSSTRPRPSTTTNPTDILNTLFSPAKWDRFFVIPATAPYSGNTLLFQQCLQKQVGRVPFYTRRDRSRLVTVRSETESIALSNLTDHSGNPIPAEPHPTLNTCTGTVSLSPANCPVDTKDWSDCGEDLLGCLKDQDVKSVHCYTIPPKGQRKNPTNIAKITFCTHDLPLRIYIGGQSLPVRPYQPPPRQCQNCWRFGHPAKHCRSTDRCPICAQPGHNRSNCSAQTRTCANCGGPHNVFYRGCPTYKFESEVATFRYKNGLILREARQEAHRQVFLILPPLVKSVPLPLPLHFKMFLHLPLYLFTSPLPLLHSTSPSQILLL